MAKGDGDKPEKKLALYHVFTEQGGTLTRVGEAEGRNAEHAVQVLSGDGDALVGKTLVIVPDRNYTRVVPEVETTHRLKFKAA